MLSLLSVLSLCFLLKHETGLGWFVVGNAGVVVDWACDLSTKRAWASVCGWKLWRGGGGLGLPILRISVWVCRSRPHREGETLAMLWNTNSTPLATLWSTNSTPPATPWSTNSTPLAKPCRADPNGLEVEPCRSRLEEWVRRICLVGYFWLLRNFICGGFWLLRNFICDLWWFLVAEK